MEEITTSRVIPVELFMILTELQEEIEVQHHADQLSGKLEWKDKNEVIYLLKQRKKLPVPYLKKLVGGEKIYLSASNFVKPFRNRNIIFLSVCSNRQTAGL
ncbi:MAG: hypothetical protein LUD02_04245 [Tannerellaceae bacterium]|nr:hypothetical protein [Tannerellaceae bacterium]